MGCSIELCYSSLPPGVTVLDIPCAYFPLDPCVRVSHLAESRPNRRLRLTVEAFPVITVVSYRTLPVFCSCQCATVILARLNNPRPAKPRMRSARRDRRSVPGRLHDGRAKAAHNGHNRPIGGRALPRSVLRKHRIPRGRRRRGLEYRHPNGCGAFWVGVSAALFLVFYKRYY